MYPMDPCPVIIKLGATLPELAAQKGDFEDWILQGMGLTRPEVRIIDPTTMDRAFVLDGTAWGVQFHPEFDAEIGRTYIRADAQVLAAGGQDPEALAAACVDTPVGTTILARFTGLVHARQL